MLTRVSPARLALVCLLALVAGLAALYVRATHQALDELRREVRADCAFKRDIAQLAGEVAAPGPITLTLAWDAWDAYVIKGCTGELGELAPPPGPRPVAAED